VQCNVLFVVTKLSHQLKQFSLSDNLVTACLNSMLITVVVDMKFVFKSVKFSIITNDWLLWQK